MICSATQASCEVPHKEKVYHFPCLGMEEPLLICIFTSAGEFSMEYKVSIRIPFRRAALTPHPEPHAGPSSAAERVGRGLQENTSSIQKVTNHTIRYLLSRHRLLYRTIFRGLSIYHNCYCPTQRLLWRLEIVKRVLFSGVCCEQTIKS